MFSFILLFGCSGEAKQKTEEDYDELVELAFEDYWDNISDKIKIEKYGNEFNGLREKSEVVIWENGRYFKLIIPRIDTDESSGVGYSEYENGEFNYVYPEDFEKATSDKEPVYVEKEGEVKKIN